MFTRTEVNLRANHDFAAYCREVVDFCPFIEPATARGLLKWREVLLRTSAGLELERRIFAEIIKEVEVFRSFRAQLNRSAQALLCFNIVFRFQKEVEHLQQEVLVWPAFAAKCLYTSQAVVFGTFWKGEREIARDGRPIPIPNLSFVSIRSKIDGLDRRFFAQTNPHLLLPHVDGIDDGRDMPAEVFGPEAIPWRKGVKALCKKGIWELVREWAEARLRMQECDSREAEA